MKTITVKSNPEARLYIWKMQNMRVAGVKTSFSPPQIIRRQSTIRGLMAMAKRPLVWETNCETDPKTGETICLFQFRPEDNVMPMAMKFSLGEWAELQERISLSQKKAGF